MDLADIRHSEVKYRMANYVISDRHGSKKIKGLNREVEKRVGEQRKTVGKKEKER